MDEHDFVFWILMAAQLARIELRQPLVMQGYWEFAMEFVMKHFQTKKPRDKAKREFRGSTSATGRALACARYREVSGKLKRVQVNHFQEKKIAYMPDFGNSRRRHASSTRRTYVPGNPISLSSTSNLAKILRKAWFMEIRMRRPHSLTHGQLSQHCGFLPQNSRIGHFLQSSQAVQ